MRQRGWGVRFRSDGSVCGVCVVCVYVVAIMAPYSAGRSRVVIFAFFYADGFG